MSNNFSGFGNIGSAPTLRVVTVSGEDRQVANMRVYFDRRVPMDDGKFEDQGGFWLTVTLWGSRAESASKILRKGSRIYVEGSLRLICIDSITYKSRREPEIPEIPDADIPY